MMRFLALLPLAVFWVTVLLVALPAAAKEGNASQADAAALALLEQVASHSQVTTTLSSPFVQERHSPLLAEPLVSEGQLCLSRRKVVATNASDDGMDVLWAYTRPAAPGFLLRQGLGSMVQGDGTLRPLNQREQTATAAIARLMALWLQPDARRIQSQYTIARPHPEAPTLVLTPRRPQFFTRLEATFAADGSALLNLLLEEKNGATLRLTFTDTRINEPLPGPCQMLGN